MLPKLLCSNCYSDLITVNNKILKIITFLILLFLLFFLDKYTNYSCSFTLYYSLLVLCVSWFINLQWGIIFCFFTVVSGFTADILTDLTHLSMGNVYIQHIEQFITYFIIAFFSSRCRLAIEYEKCNSHYDFLTNLVNTRGFYKSLNIERKRCQRDNTNLAILYIDCDNFKQINDSYGHSEGDKLLIHIASLLKKHVRAVDIVARIGGDEFAVIFVNIDLKLLSSNTNRLHINITDEIQKLGFNVTFSMGLGIFKTLPDDNDNIVFLVDDLMYHSKKTGKNKITMKIFNKT